MPPWPRRCLAGHVGEEIRKLTARERATIVSWARAGGRIDGPARKPLKPKSTLLVPVANASSICRCPWRTSRARRRGRLTTTAVSVLDPKLAGDSSATGAHRPGRRESRPPRDPLPRHEGAGRRREAARPSRFGVRLDVLRRNGPSCSATAGRSRACSTTRTGRRVGPLRLGRRPAPGGNASRFPPEARS